MRYEEIVIKFDQPWEETNSYHEIIKDGDIYRMYYGCTYTAKSDNNAMSDEKGVLCYAESRDGIHWEKPNLRIREFEGSWDNNIIMDRDTDVFYDSRYVFIDENPDCPAEERYKAIGLNTIQDPLTLVCHTSPDGIHFKKGWVMAQKGRYDTLNVAMWMPEEQCYVAFMRWLHEGIENHDDYGVRDIRRMTSKDFKNWSEPELLDYMDGEDYPLYTNQIQRYPRAPHMLIGFPSRYVERKKWTANFDQLAGPEARKERYHTSRRFGLATTDCVFMVSNDLGRHFKRYDEAFLTAGIEREKNWVYGDCFPAYGLVETPSALENAPDEYSMFVPENHWYAGESVLRRYTIRKDGFVSLHAPYAERKVYTKPFVFEGNKMELNFATSARGYVYVRIIGKDAAVTSCELFGDALDRIVPFDGELGDLAGKEVVMEITMSDADVYSFRFFES